MAFSPPPPPPPSSPFYSAPIPTRGHSDFTERGRGVDGLTARFQSTHSELFGGAHSPIFHAFLAAQALSDNIGAHNTLTGVDSTHHFTLGNTPSNKFRISKRFKLMRFRHNPTPRHRAKFLLRQLFGTYLTVIGILEKRHLRTIFPLADAVISSVNHCMHPPMEYPRWESVDETISHPTL